MPIIKQLNATKFRSLKYGNDTSDGGSSRQPYMKVELKDILKRESEDVIELIKKLGDLHSAGILTDEEFSNKKSELLSKI